MRTQPRDKITAICNRTVLQLCNDQRPKHDKTRKKSIDLIHDDGKKNNNSAAEWQNTAEKSKCETRWETQYSNILNWLWS